MHFAWILLFLLSVTNAQLNTTTFNNNNNNNNNSPPSQIRPLTAVALTFLAMVASIIGASIPVLISLHNNKSFKSMRTQAPNASPEKFTACTLGFAAGALLFVALYDLLPDSVVYFTALPSIGKKYASLLALLTFVIGMVSLVLLEKIIFWLTPGKACPCHNRRVCLCKIPELCGCASQAQDNQIKRTSWLTFLAMTIHNIFEGLVFYIAATTDLKAGAIIGLILLINVFPEGLAMGAVANEAYPTQHWRGPVYGAIAGIAQPVGAVIGFLAFNGDFLNAGVLGKVYGATAGMLFTIATRGLLPYARFLDKQDKVVTFSTFVGAILIFVTLSMFEFAGFDDERGFMLAV